MVSVKEQGGAAAATTRRWVGLAWPRRDLSMGHPGLSACSGLKKEAGASAPAVPFPRYTRCAIIDVVKRNEALRCPRRDRA